MSNPEVAEFINKLHDKPNQEWQVDVCSSLRQLALENIPDVSERIQYGKPHFLKAGKYAAVLGTAKGWVTFTIFNAKDLEAPEGFFEPGDPDRKTVKILKGQPVDYAFLGKLLKKAAKG